jgi:hypothetical protein
VEAVDARIAALLSVLRPEAVCLVDAFGLSDDKVINN